MQVIGHTGLPVAAITDAAAESALGNCVSQ